MTYHFNPAIFREYDIRGTFNKSLFAQDAYEIGLRFATLMKAEAPSPLICIGRDGRLSSPELTLELIKGLREAGADILDIGVGPTPMLYFATKTTPAIGGIMVTGSHNPSQDNGFKITLKDAPFFGSQIQLLKETTGQKTPHRGSIEFIDLRENYINRILLDHPTPSTKKLKIAWDCGNGASGEIVEFLTKQLLHSSFLLNTKIDGTFPAHHPDPSIEENLIQLKRLVTEEQCDLGIAFDGDADRIGVIDAQGRILWGDQLLSILAQDVLVRNPGAEIIADIKCSQACFDTIKKYGGIPVMGKTGHSNIKKQMKEINAALAGEMSGHIFYNDIYYGYDDAIYSALRLISFLESQTMTLADYYDALPKYHSTPEIRIPCNDSKKFEIIDKIRDDLIKENTNFIDIDGVRVTTQQGWWLVRASNTQAMIVARCEAFQEDGLPNLITHMKKALSPYVVIPI